MELDEQIYVNVEELRATCSTKHRGSEETGRPVKYHIIYNILYNEFGYGS